MTNAFPERALGPGIDIVWPAHPTSLSFIIRGN